MTVRVYRSTDTSAPIMTGLASTLISLLDACLVNGYGSNVAAGWSKAFSSGSTQGAYKQGAGGNGMYLQVVDSNTYWATILGFENMTSISSGTGQFPSPATLAITTTSSAFIKSMTGDATVRPWILIATAKTFHLWINVNSETTTSMSYPQYMFFGDINSYRVGDAYNTMLITGYGIVNYSQTVATSINTTLTVGLQSHYMARSWTQLGASINVGKFSDNIRRSFGAYPSITDNQFCCSPWCVTEMQGVPRGIMPGVWSIDFDRSQPSSLIQGQRFTFTSGDLAGKTLECQYAYPTAAILFEISNTW